MKLTFCGGAGAVTGSSYLLESGGTKILVDCGLHQGGSFNEDQNFLPFLFKPEEISAVFVTHAHIDHIGRLPQLVKQGFKGIIYSAPPTKDFAELLLLDSEHLLKEESDKRKKPPLYETADIIKTMGFWQKRKYHEIVKVGDFTIELYDAGHILGSSSILVSVEGKKVVFSGDLGNNPSPFINPTEYIKDADYALVESAYGNRVHELLDKRKEIVEDTIEETVRAGGVLMIPAFAMERTQEMIFELNELVENGRIPKVPVFIDSPLAIKLTAVYQKYSTDPLYFNPEAIDLIKGGDAIFNFPGLRMTLTKEESKEINNVPPPKVIVAGAGMSNGGRILHHEIRYLPDPKSTLLVVGYQAVGSLGRKVLEGAKMVKIFGEEVRVECKVKQVSGYSAHADQPQLLKWVEEMHGTVKKVFVVQGDGDESAALAQKIKDELAILAEVPSYGESVTL
ncbi:MAG: MBL fold metallo-hydrolase [Minisyncoccia bacterium]|jgi:metallo-beta-lactamase family protein